MVVSELRFPKELGISSKHSDLSLRTRSIESFVADRCLVELIQTKGRARRTNSVSLPRGKPSSLHFNYQEAE